MESAERAARPTPDEDGFDLEPDADAGHRPWVRIVALVALTALLLSIVVAALA